MKKPPVRRLPHLLLHPATAHLGFALALGCVAVGVSFTAGVTGTGAGGVELTGIVVGAGCDVVKAGVAGGG